MGNKEGAVEYTPKGVNDMEVILSNNEGIDEWGGFTGRPGDVIGSSTATEVGINGSVNHPKTRLITNDGIGEEWCIGLSHKNGSSGNTADVIGDGKYIGTRRDVVEVFGIDAIGPREGIGKVASDHGCINPPGGVSKTEHRLHVGRDYGT